MAGSTARSALAADRRGVGRHGLQPILLSGLHGSTERPWDMKEFGTPGDVADIDLSAVLRSWEDRFGRAGLRRSHKIAIGLTGEPVPVGSRSGATTHRNDQRPAAAHACASSAKSR
jgi:hypothetical protein